MRTVEQAAVIFIAFLLFCMASEQIAFAGSRSQAKARIARGRKLLGMNGCLDCHRAGGKGFAEGVPLDGLRKRRTRAFVLSHLRDPEGHVERNKKAFHGDPNLMPNPNLSEAEIKLIVDYLLRLPARGSR